VAIKYGKFPANPVQPGWANGRRPVYDFNPAVAIPEKRSKMNTCKHPRVQIVAREEDSEFVECLECGDIFESSEFKDMAIEESKLDSDPPA